MKNISSILKIIFKNIGVFLCSTVLTSLILYIKAGGFDALVFGPVLIVYLFVFGVAGGILGVIIYNIVKFFKREK